MTIKEIARLCGVSRGTVDRVLNRRGRVNPETEARVLGMIEKTGYTKNIAGRALTVRKTAPVIGVAVSSKGNPFFGQVIRGMLRAEGELRDYGVTVSIRAMRGYDVQEQLRLIASLEDQISALVLQPINDPLIRNKILQLREQGIPSVTVNTDLSGSARACYVGSDYQKGGETMAGLMGLMTGGHGLVGVITGSESVLGHVQRLNGFERRLCTKYPGLQIVSRAGAEDDPAQAYEAAKKMLLENPGIDALFVVAAGACGVCRAVKELGRADAMRVFTFDCVPSTVEMMRAGLIPAVICQQPFRQGYEAVRAAFDLILSGQPAREKRMIIENQIKILENV